MRNITAGRERNVRQSPEIRAIETRMNDRPPETDEQIGQARERKEPLLFVVDRLGQVVYEALENAFDQVVEFCCEPRRLRPEIVAVAKSLIDAPSTEKGAAARSAFVAPGHLMRLRRLSGSGDPLFALILEPFRNRDTVRVAARRYGLTKREHEILMLILEGANAVEMADALHISEHTVQGYFKRLLKKTNSRNRAAMVANVLEWTPTTSKLTVS